MLICLIFIFTTIIDSKQCSDKERWKLTDFLVYTLPNPLKLHKAARLHDGSTCFLLHQISNALVHGTSVPYGKEKRMFKKIKLTDSNS